MNLKSTFLLAKARAYVEQLSQHPVLSRHWPAVSAVVKGSTARGNADRYSDVDLVLFADEAARKRIVRDYFRSGLINRQDGLFILFQEKDFDGHYHVESFAQLAGYFAHGDFIHAWDYQCAIPLHDPGNRYAQTIAQGMRDLFVEPLAHVKRAYLDLQLDLDWMRHPLKRGDAVSAFLHAASLTRGICRASYLLDARAYPPDKWLIAYLGATRFGRANKRRITGYAHLSAQLAPLTRHLSLDDYPLYREASALIAAIARFAKTEFGDQPWLDRWWEFV